MAQDNAIRKIIHVDMDAFFAAVEQRDDPKLRGKPVVVAWKGARSVVCAASYEARQFGLHSAMSALRAEALCPQVIFVPPDFVRYKAVSQHIREIFHRYTDLVEPLSLDEAYLDVTHNKMALGSATAVAQSIRAAIWAETQLTASAGIAANKFLAKIASDWRKPNGQFVIRPRDADAFLLPLKVGKIPGVGKVTQQKLAQLGITTVAQMRCCERGELVRHFGRFGAILFDLAQGIDPRPVQTSRTLQQISVEETLARDLPLGELLPLLRQLCQKLWTQAARKKLFGRTVVLKLKTARFQILTRSQSFSSPPQSQVQLELAVEKLLTRVNLPISTLYRLVGVGMGHVQYTVQQTDQMGLFE